MNNPQKERILELLKSAEANRNYANRYWFSYKDFLDPADGFTGFACENLEGKQGYLALIENLRKIDASAKVFVEVYGYEEVDGDAFIDAETLIIFSKASLTQIQQIFNEPEDIFPSGIGEESDFSQPAFLIDDKGALIPMAAPSGDAYSVYYCWWD